MFWSKQSPTKNENSDFEVQDFDDPLEHSIRGRLTRIVREIAVNRSGLDIRAGPLNISHQWIIQPNSLIYSLWTKFVLVLAVYSSLFTPFEFGFFRGLPRVLWITDIVVQFFFFADVIITFFVAFKDVETYRLVTDFRPIAVRYARGDLIPDILACLPWDSIYKATGRKEEVRFLVWLRLYRARKVTGFLEDLEKDIRVNYFATRILKLIFVEFYCTHVAACFFYYLATTVSSDREGDTWIGSLQLGDRSYHDFRHVDVGTRYVTSLYWAIITMATIGYGDIHAVNNREMLFIILFASVDMILGAYLIGNMTALIVKGSNTEKFRDKMAELIKYMNRNSLDKNLRHQMKCHVRLQFESKMTNDSVIEDFPVTIRAKVAQELYRSTVEHVSLFKGCTSEFISQVVSRVREEFFLPGEVILEQRDAVDQLYIISYGLLEEVVVGEDGVEKPVAQLEDYSVFGEVAVLCNVPQPYTVRVVELCKLLRLDKQSFSNLLQIYYLDGRQIINNLLVGKESDDRLRQRAADINYLLSKQDAELALMVIHAAYQGDISHVRQLIKAGADPTRTDYDGRTALHLAAARGHKELVLFLISENADLNAIDNNGITPLLEALKGGHDVTAGTLYEKGARLLLQEAGAFLCNVSMTGDIEFLKRLLAYGADPNSVDYDLRTPLHVAASEGLHLIASVLVGAGANINAKDRWGNTALEDARRTGNGTVVTLLETSVTIADHSLEPTSHDADPPGTALTEDGDRISDSIAAAAVRKKQIEAMLERVRGTSMASSGRGSGSSEPEQSRTNSESDETSVPHRQVRFGEDQRKQQADGFEISEWGMDSDRPRGYSSSPHNRSGRKSRLKRESRVSRRVTIFPYHPWTPEEKRTAGVVVWAPGTIEELLGIAVEQFGGTRSFILNGDGGEIRSTDLIAENDRLYIVGDLCPR